MHLKNEWTDIDDQTAGTHQLSDTVQTAESWCSSLKWEQKELHSNYTHTVLFAKCTKSLKVKLK